MSVVEKVTPTVVIGGRAVDPVSVQIDREIATTLPTVVSSGGGIQVATARLSVDEPETVIQERHGPWAPVDGWPPAQGEAATVDVVVDEAAAVRRFTGRVSAVSGSAQSPVAVGLADRTGSLVARVSVPALMGRMPPSDGRTEHRDIGLRPDYYADAAMRAAGWWSTPLPEAGSTLRVPAQGSLMPELGSVVWCKVPDVVTTPDGLPQWRRSSWGWCVGALDAMFNVGAGTSQVIGAGGDALQMTMMCDASLNGAAATLTARTAAGAAVQLTVLASEAVQFGVQGGTTTTWTPPAGWRVVELRVTAAGAWEVRTDNGGSTTWTQALSAALASNPITQVRVFAGLNAAVGGFQVSHVPSSSAALQAVTQPLTARLRPGTLVGVLSAVPAVVDRTAQSVLAEISEALCVSQWIDEDGVLQWVHPDVLRAQEPIGELTSSADLLDLAWENAAGSARSKVTVGWQQPTTMRRTVPSVTVWEGRGDAGPAADITNDIVTTPAREGWCDVAEMQYLSLTSATGDFNRGIGSWVGLVRIYDSGGTDVEEWVSPADGAVTADLVQLSANSWMIERENVGVPSTWTVAQRVPEDDTRIVGSRRGKPLPVLRAKARFEMADQRTTAATTGDPLLSPLEHDAGPWVQSSANATALANWLAGQVIAPVPTLRELPIGYRSDVRLGQVWDVVENAVYGARMRVVVTGITEQHADGTSDLSLTCRVLSITQERITYDSLTDRWAGQDYAAMTAAWAPQTYAALTADPLGP